jgi:hypothetical protein
LSTGLPGLDRVFTGILPGDNIVWQVDAVDDNRPFVDPFVRDAIARGKRLVYFRFARHPEPYLCDLDTVTCFALLPDGGQS